MFYNISIMGMGSKNNSCTVFTMATTQSNNRRYCFNKLREYLIRKTKSAYEESGCFERIEFEVHIGRIKNNESRLDDFIIPAIDVLNYRGFKDETNSNN